MSQPTKRLLGEGKARNFKAGPGETLIEVGRTVYAVGQNFFCQHCDGCGCRSCGWSGEEERRLAIRRAR